MPAAIEIAIHVLGGADAPARTSTPTRTVPHREDAARHTRKRKAERPWTASRG